MYLAYNITNDNYNGFYSFLKALQINKRERGREGQLTLAKLPLCADGFIHILRYSLHENAAISFGLQMKKPWLTKIQSPCSWSHGCQVVEWRFGPGLSDSKSSSYYS